MIRWKSPVAIKAAGVFSIDILPSVIDMKHNICYNKYNNISEVAMNQTQMFGKAIWLESAGTAPTDIWILRGKFQAHQVKKATLRVLGMGYFHCYINGERVGDDLFAPLNTDYEPREKAPIGEVLTSHRTYVPEYDVTRYLKDGENNVAIHFGGGWYTSYYYFSENYGTPKAIWRIFGEDACGAFDFTSSEKDKITKSFVYEYHITTVEKQDYRIISDAALAADYNDSAWQNAIAAKAPDTEYLFTDCPYDGVIETIAPKIIDSGEEFVLYDCGENTTGYPVLEINQAAGQETCVVFGEELGADGMLDPRFVQGQSFTCVGDGQARTVKPLFLWYGFRYFAVYGNARVKCVEVVHAKIKPRAVFKSDNETLNWLHDTFLHTQLTNMHGGIPSDCPHLERRGYTGDGELICHAAMNLLDAKAFYRKWIEDICDCQDALTGHVQYTAPYFHSGGGPGGWGCAIVEVPYEYYRQYGDVEVLARTYLQMLRYFDYLESHSDRDLVISDKPGDWCLGDWCPPIQVILPPPFVNNYFYIKSLQRCVEIAPLVGRELDLPMLQARIQDRKNALMSAYFNPADGDFIGNVQGANAFAVDIGLGDERTYRNLENYYSTQNQYDTGIFGTDVVTRVLFAHGDSETAVGLLTGEGVHSFAEMKKRGATTLGEYWPDSLEDRSHNHPMFGAVVGYFYDYLLGIRPVCAGYSQVVISPAIVSQINEISGYREVAGGKLEVSYQKHDGQIDLCITVPEGVQATLDICGTQTPLQQGMQRLRFAL